MTESEYLSAYQAAEFLGVSHTTIYRYIDRGVLPTARAHGVVGPLRIPRSALDKMVPAVPSPRPELDEEPAHVDDPSG